MHRALVANWWRVRSTRCTKSLSSLANPNPTRSEQRPQTQLLMPWSRPRRQASRLFVDSGLATRPEIVRSLFTAHSRKKQQHFVVAVVSSGAGMLHLRELQVLCRICVVERDREVVGKLAYC